MEKGKETSGNNLYTKQYYEGPVFFESYQTEILTKDGQIIWKTWYERNKEDIDQESLDERQIRRFSCPKCRAMFTEREVNLGRLFTKEELVTDMISQSIKADLLSQYPNLLLEEPENIEKCLNAISEESKKILDAKINVSEESKKVLNVSDIIMKDEMITCPSCGYTGKSIIAPSWEKLALDVWENDRTLSFRYSEIMYIEGQHMSNICIPKKYTQSIVLNKQTRRIYYITPKNRVRGLRNVDTIQYPYEVWKDILDTMLRFISVPEHLKPLVDQYVRLANDRTTSLASYQHETNVKNSIQLLMQVFQYPEMPADFHKTMLDFNAQGVYESTMSSPIVRTSQKLRSIHTPEEMIRYAAHSLHVSVKRFGKQDKKLIYSNPLYISVYKFYYVIGITDHNIIRAQAENIMNILVLEARFNGLTKFATAVSEGRNPSKALDKLLYALGDNGSKDLKNTVEDSIRMYNQCLHADVKPRLKGNYTEIHNFLMKEVEKIRHPLREIDYDDNETTLLNRDVKGIDFNLAKSTMELIDVGHEMGICVGSYGEKAVRHSSYIVLMSVGDKHVGCLELSKVGKKTSEWHLVQAKAKYNNKLQGIHAEALRDWVKKCGIITRDCYDYEHIAHKNIQPLEDEIQSTYRYDRVN